MEKSQLFAGKCTFIWLKGYKIYVFLSVEGSLKKEDFFLEKIIDFSLFTEH